MPAALYESRFCRFEVPPGWMAVPGLGALERRSRGIVPSAIVSENWLEEPSSAAVYARRQWEVLEGEQPGTALLEEKALAGERFRDAYMMAFRAPGPEGVPLRQEQLVTIEGPLAACLMLTGPEADQDRAWQALDLARRSFAITARDWLRQITRGAGVQGTSGAAPTKTAVPHLQITLPVPPGWNLDAGTGTLRSAGGAQITVRRGGLPASSPEELFADALARAHREGVFRPRAWNHSETPQGWDSFTLESVSVPGGGTWTRTKPRIAHEVFVKDEGTIAFHLEGEEGDQDAMSALASVVSEYALLSAAERRLRLPYPWMPLELAGVWQEEGPGTFVRSDGPPLMLSIQRIPAPQGYREFAETAASSLRTAAQWAADVSEEGRHDSTNGIPFARYVLGFRDAEGRVTSIRAAWFDQEKEIVSLIIRGTDAQADCEDLFRRCLEALRPMPSAAR